MAKKAADTGSKVLAAALRKRKAVEPVEERENGVLTESLDEELMVEGLLEDEASDSENEDEDQNGAEDEADSEEDDNDDNAALNALLGEEEDALDYDSEDFSDEPQDDSVSVTDKLLNVKIHSNTEEGILSTYSNGQERIIMPEIDPVYDSDDLDVENFNTIGNVPLLAYDEMPHLGYDINGKRIMRPAKGLALDQLLEQIDLPEGWTGLLDQSTGEALKLTAEELELIAKIQNNEQTDGDIDPYQPTIEWFTLKTEQMPLTAVPEPKRRFVPSKHEAKRIMKIVKAIREGKIVPGAAKRQAEEEQQPDYDLWANEEAVADHIMNLRAPKVAPPTNDESYNPPEEYLMTEEEKKAWEEAAPSDRDHNYIPQKYLALRKVPAYQEGVRERFERCLDLYLAPRVRHNKLNIDPELLIPELPLPKDLRPFPIKCLTVYSGHTGRIRTLSIDPRGLWLATGSDDGSVRIWEILTGRQVYKVQLVDVAENPEDKVECVEWNPDANVGLLAVAAGENIYLLVPPIFGFDIENVSRLRVESGWGFDTFEHRKAREDEDGPKKEVAKWLPPSEQQTENGIAAVVQCRTTVKKVSWHRKGDYLVSVSPDSKNTAVLIHQLLKHLSQLPFKKSKGIIVDAKFHPFKPQLFVCSQRTVRIYDLAQQVLIKKLLPGARWLSGIDVHPRGDHLLAASYDKRVLWHDLDLSLTPYKTLRYHEKAVRSIKFHRTGLPLFASASDDGSIHVFHGTVYDDLMTNPLLVPLKKLAGHKVVDSIGVLDLVWHPREAWLFSAGADGTARLWTT